MRACACSYWLAGTLISYPLLIFPEAPLIGMENADSCENGFSKKEKKKKILKFMNGDVKIKFWKKKYFLFCWLFFFLHRLI